MSRMKPTSRTVNPLHFEDLEPHRFEDLIRQLAHGFRTWRTLEATGRLGGDEGVDIRGVEVVSSGAELRDGRDDGEREGETEEVDYVPGPVVETREWRFQCKRYKEIGPTAIRAIVKETVPSAEGAPYGLVIAAACDVSAQTLAAFREEQINLGITEGHLWSKAHLEDLLFRPENDHLLFAYFGISLVTRRRSRVREIQTNLATKRKIRRAVGVDELSHIRIKNVLIRNIEDLHYPFESKIEAFDSENFPDWHTGELYGFYHAGVMVRTFVHRGWVKSDGVWDVSEQLRQRCGEQIMHYSLRQTRSEQEVEAKLRRAEAEDRLYSNVPDAEKSKIIISRCLPFSSILEVDPWGAPPFAGPHLFCQFDGNEWGPYQPECGQAIVTDNLGPRRLDPRKRMPLFDPFENPEMPTSRAEA